jgi:plasmid maintenance system killer protein
MNFLTLKDLELSGKKVIVRVHTFEHEWASELAKAGLKEAVLQASIERQLEKSGIAVIPEEASRKTETEGILNVRVKFLDPEPLKKTFLTTDEDKIERLDPKKKYVYAIRLNFRQPASLRRNPETTVFAITWQTESVGLRRLALIREDFENVVNAFIEAYLSENPNIKKTD